MSDQQQGVRSVRQPRKRNKLSFDVPPDVFPGMFQVTASLLMFAGLALLSGCGPQSDLLQISGEVSFNGAPLKSGSIRITSLPGAKQSSTGAMIREGKYMIPQEKGLLPGSYSIAINAADEAAPKVQEQGQGMAFAQELIPPEYNVRSQKTIDVTVDGENHFVFDIVSDGAGTQ